MLAERINSYIEKNSLIPQGETIIVGFSGGPDSLCLAHVLARLSQRNGWKLILAHFDHCLRGDASSEDARFCRAWAKTNNLDIYVLKQDVEAEARRNGESTELAARKCRYAFFKHIQDETGASRIALGHHRDDQAETVLMRLIRGTGTDGLAGIRAIRPDGVVRPLLGQSRQAIMAYCDSHGLSPRMDLTNQETLYTRNLLRLEVLPLLSERFNPRIAEALCRTAEIAGEDSDCLNAIAAEALESMGMWTTAGLELPLKQLGATAPAIMKRMLRQGVRRLTGTSENLEAEHLDQIMKLMAQAKTGKRMVFCGTLFAVGYGTLILSKNNDSAPEPEAEIPVTEGTVEVFGGRLTLRTIQRSEWQPGGVVDPCRAVIDGNSLVGALIVRKRNIGDRMIPLGMDVGKKLKEIMIDKKIPRALRDSVPVICDSEKIIWVAGIQMDQRVRVTPESENLLELCWEVCCSPDRNVLE